MAITKRKRTDESKVVSKSSRASAAAMTRSKESAREPSKEAMSSSPNGSTRTVIKENAKRAASATAAAAAAALATAAASAGVAASVRRTAAELAEELAGKSSKKLSKKELIARRNEYAAKFFPYIEKVARRLARRLPAHVEIDDLISSGVIGLMEAADRFDPSRVDRFEAFAEFRIRGAMLDDLRSRDTLSRDMRRLSNELRDATRRLEAQLGRTPDQEEIAKRLGVGVEELYARQQKLSGSSVVGIDDAGPDLLERTGDQTAADPFEQASRRELTERMVSGIGHLPEKMQQVLSLYYCDNLNLKEIGAVLGVTESRVCQIHGEATRRLRDSLSDLAGEAAA
jgi:RNA polymerase sigma factor for flagellar operon FliA